MNRKCIDIQAVKLLLAVITFLLSFSPLSCAETITILHYEKSNPKVNISKIKSMNEGVKAILAMYALQNGGGCSGGHSTMRCLLTEALDLKGQCTKEHLDFVRKWFNKAIPKMHGYQDHLFNNIDKSENLETICYKVPDSASIQHLWTNIQIKIDGNHISVNAKGSWLVREETGTFRYLTKYRLNKDSIAVVSHKEIIPLKSKKLGCR